MIFSNRKLKRIAIVITPVVLVFILIFSLISRQPAVAKVITTPKDVKIAVNAYRKLSEQLFSNKRDFHFSFNETELLSIARTSSKSIPLVDLNIQIISGVVMMSATIDISRFFESSYINVSCLVVPDGINSIDSCQIGRVEVSGKFAELIIKLVTKIFFDESISRFVSQVLSGLSVTQDSIVIVANKGDDFEMHAKNGVKAMVSTVKSLKSTHQEALEANVLMSYMEHMLHDRKIDGHREVSLSTVFSSAFGFAKQRSRYNDPRKENEYAIWAVAIAFSNARFSELIQIESLEFEQWTNKSSSINVLLSGRRDLALHFLYSAIIERVGNERFANNIGEIKELFDANSGGSGFDLSDLAADMSGSRFSYFISYTKNNAIFAQSLLASENRESNFFPLKYAEYKVIELKEPNLSESNYEQLINKITEDIRALPLYVNLLR